ncbi:MAG: hypothetical protein F4X99_05810 [Gammaproteobacteria bacterium]|nr:hypothetical protein [Gammaproteobacteria bacterium]
MRLQEICEEIMEDVDGALGCALVDLGTGLPLAMQVTSDALLDSGAMEILSAAGAEYFRGEVGHQLESAMGGGAGRPPADTGFVEEIQTTTEDSYHFMSIVPGNEQTVLMLITDRTANLGLGWVAMRRTLRRVQEGTRRPARRVSSAPIPKPASPAVPEPETPAPTNGNANRRAGRRGIRGR